jgi:membrane-associated protease RseP (regulator of RpoE activity)
MVRYRVSHAFLFVVFCSLLAAGSLVVRYAQAAPDVVELDGDTHHNPPASTTDLAAPVPTPTRDTSNRIDKGAKEVRETAKDDAAEEKLKLRAGERVGADARGSAQVLGMSLQEGTHQRMKVVNVALNSPAFDAGVMKGDEIVAFQGFRGESYRKWIDGIQRLTADTAPGLKISVVIARDGKQMTVPIEVPQRPVRPSTPPILAQPGNTAAIQPGLGPGTPSAIVGGNGGNSVVFDNSGPFGEFFGGETATANDRAIAHLVRIGGQPLPKKAPGTPGAPQNSTTGAAAAPPNGAARIGMAGFRDEPSGMMVMVDVGALPPGNYNVAITDPSTIVGAAATGTGVVNPNVPRPPQLAPPQAPPPAPGTGGTVVPKGAAPAQPAAPQTPQPQSNLPPASNRLVPYTVLAQVAATAEPANTELGSSSAADKIRPTGEVIPPSSTPTGQLNDGQGAQAAQATTGTAQNVASAAPVGAALNQIGTITIDQSGTGRMQQKLENVQVRSVVGQAIVLYSQGGPQTSLPANLNGSAGSAKRQGVTDSTARDSQRPTDAIGGQGSAASQTATPQQATPQQATPNSQVPVAGGIIQLVTDRRPPPTTVPATTQAPAATNGAIQQPASATPPAGQNLVR